MAKPRLKDRQALSEELVLPRRVLVHVTRDMTEVIPRIVFEHEIDILAEVFGANAVQVVEDSLEHQILIANPDDIDRARKVAETEAKKKQKVSVLYYHHENPMQMEEGKWVPAPVYVGEEMARLRTAYGINEDKKEFYVDIAYPHEQNFIEACGGVYKAKNAA